MAPTIPNIKLSSGHDMPQVGFGLWKVNNETCADTVYNAIKAGYRLLDGAADYGNEVECGQGVARAIKDGLVKREDLFIVSKLWQTFHEKERVPEACRRSLEDWGLEYFDLYLIHFPAALAYVDPKVRYPPGWQVDGKDTIQWSNATTQETWTAMEGLVASGLSKSIGISNFSAQLIYDMLRYAKIRPATLQIEHHPFYVQPELIRLAKEEGIAVTAYSSFGPASFVEFGWQHAKDFTPLREDPVITAIAEKYGKKPTQVLLRWSTQRGLAVIPKTNRTELLEENMDVIGWDMTQEELDSISAKDRNLKFNKPTNYFTSEKLWLFT